MKKCLIIIGILTLIVTVNFETTSNCSNLNCYSDTIFFHDSTFLRNSHTGSRDMFVAKFSNPDIKGIISLDSLILPDNILNISDGNYTDFADYTYHWSTGDTTREINILSPGWYWVTVTKDLNRFVNTHNFAVGDKYRHIVQVDSAYVANMNVIIRIDNQILIKGNSMLIINSIISK